MIIILFQYVGRYDRVSSEVLFVMCVCALIDMCAMELGMMFFVKQLSLLLFIDVSWPCIWRQFQCNTAVYSFLAWTVLLHFPISDSDFCRSDSALAVDCACVISASTVFFLVYSHSEI